MPLVKPLTLFKHYRVCYYVSSFGNLPISVSGIYCIITSLRLFFVIQTGKASPFPLTTGCWLCVVYNKFTLPLCLFSFLFFICLFFLTLRSSSIRPGQFGYGRVPFSLPLHRQNRQARHTVNGTEDATVAPEQAAPEDITESNRGEEEEAERGERDRQEEENAEREISETPAAEKVPTVPTIRPLLRPSHTHTQHGRARGQVPPSHPLSRSSLPSVFSSRQRFDWSSVTAPPPPVPPLSRPYSPAAGSPFSPPLHRSSPVHRDRELHPAFSPQAPPAGSIYPLQHPHVSHLGMESGREGGAPRTYTCAGPEKEYRRCFSQVRPKDCVQIFTCESSTHN